MKLCKDCKHFAPVTWCYSGILAPYPGGPESSVPNGCRKNMPTDPVTGKRVFQSAATVRSDYKKCGATGKWFRNADS